MTPSLARIDLTHQETTTNGGLSFISSVTHAKNLSKSDLIELVTGNAFKGINSVSKSISAAFNANHVDTIAPSATPDIGQSISGLFKWKN